MRVHSAAAEQIAITYYQKIIHVTLPYPDSLQEPARKQQQLVNILPANVSLTIIKITLSL